MSSEKIKVNIEKTKMGKLIVIYNRGEIYMEPFDEWKPPSQEILDDISKNLDFLKTAYRLNNIL